MSVRTRAVGLAVAAAALAAAAGCGSRSASTRAVAAPRPVSAFRTRTVLERQFGTDANGVHVFTPRRRAWDAVVVFVHGHGGPGEIGPMYHRPWLRHLAAEGAAVLYPRYEVAPGGGDAARHVDRGVATGLRVLHARPGVRIVGIGYSRGGRLVVDWAALAPRSRQPRGILSVFPASAEEPDPDLRRIRRTTTILMLVGDHDEVVGNLGALDLLRALRSAGFPGRRIGYGVVRSTRGFTASHLSVLGDSPEARLSFWEPADRLLAAVRAGRQIK